MTELMVNHHYLVDMYWQKDCEVVLVGTGTGQPQFVGKVAVEAVKPGPRGQVFWMCDGENLRPLQGGIQC